MATAWQLAGRTYLVHSPYTSVASPCSSNSAVSDNADGDVGVHPRFAMPYGAGPAIAQGCATAHRHTGTAGARPGTRDPLGLAASCEFTYPSNAALL